jgi:hypothetical protein
MRLCGWVFLNKSCDGLGCVVAHHSLAAFLRYLVVAATRCDAVTTGMPADTRTSDLLQRISPAADRRLMTHPRQNPSGLADERHPVLSTALHCQPVSTHVHHKGDCISAIIFFSNDVPLLDLHSQEPGMLPSSEPVSHTHKIRNLITMNIRHSNFLPPASTDFRPTTRERSQHSPPLDVAVGSSASDVRNLASS